MFGWKQRQQDKAWGLSQRRMYWQINRCCNFDCPYCFRDPDEKRENAAAPSGRSWSPEHVAACFNQTGKTWDIYITGGEPLLYPNFVALIQALTQRHYVSVSTNLSTANAYDLAETVANDRLHRIMANLHITEREKRSDGMAEYLRKFHRFQERRFNIELVYVAYPPLLSRIEQDIAWLRREGVARVTVKVFQGRYAGKVYPRDYGGYERSVLKRLGLNDAERQILDRHISYLGRWCQAACRGFTMDPAGNVTRCVTLRQPHGNLLEGTFRPGASARRCPARRCACAYQGMTLTNSEGMRVPSSSLARFKRVWIQFREQSSRLLMPRGDVGRVD